MRSGGFSSTEYYPNASGPGDCGTFLYLNSDTIPNTLFGPDFASHAGGTHTTGFPIPETPFTASAGNQSFTGTGTAGSPYRVTTVVMASVLNQSGGTVALQITEVDSYVVGDNFYETDVTVKNIGGPNDASLDEGAELYHAADCQLRGLDTGLGAFEPNSQSADHGCMCAERVGQPTLCARRVHSDHDRRQLGADNRPDHLGEPRRECPQQQLQRLQGGRG